MSKSELQEQYYMGDPNLPTIKATYEYTPEIVSEIKKCLDYTTNKINNSN